MPIAADESLLFTAVKDLVQKALAGRLIAKRRDSPRRAASTQRPQVQRLQDGGLNRPGELVTDHLGSLGTPRVIECQTHDIL